MKPLSEPSQGRENAYLGWTDNQLLRRPPGRAVSGCCIVTVELLSTYFLGNFPNGDPHEGLASATVLPYTVTTGAVAVLVELVGPGGGGGGSGGSSNAAAAAGGGGAGGYASSLILSPAASYDFYLGLGGTAGDNTGSDGGTSDFTWFGPGPDETTALCYAESGGGGFGVNAAGARGHIGIGASGIPIGDVVLYGANGGTGHDGVGGTGGGSYFAGGGAGAATNTTPGAQTASIGLHGAGGGGGAGTSDTGGAGGDGMIIVTTYV